MGKGVCVAVATVLLLLMSVLIAGSVAAHWYFGVEPLRPTPQQVEDVRRLASEIGEESKGADFFYDGRLKQLYHGTMKLEDLLNSVSGYQLVYPMMEDGITRGIVFVTYTDTCYTTGYLVTTTTNIPSGHRPGPFMSLTRMDRHGKNNIVYVFESR
jgi:hypothetical protein